MKAKDFTGTPIVPGSRIVFAAMVGRSPRLTLGVVLSVGHKKDSYYKWSIKVQPLEDSWGGRYSNTHYENGKIVTKGLPKPVFLHFTDRLYVISGQTEPAAESAGEAPEVTQVP